MDPLRGLSGETERSSLVNELILALIVGASVFMLVVALAERFGLLEPRRDSEDSWNIVQATPGRPFEPDQDSVS